MRAAAKQTLGAATRAVSPKVTERASPARKSRGRGDRQALCQSDAIAVPELFGSVLALSVSSQAPRQLPQRGSHWHVGQLSSGRAKHNISEAAVLRCLGQRQLDKERCPEAAAPVSKARPFASCRASGVQWKVIRPAKGSPSGRAGAKRLRGRTRCPRKQGPLFCVLSSLSRPVESYPACQRLPLWGSCRAKRD